MDRLTKMDLEELKNMRKKAEELDKYALVNYVKSWGDCTKSSLITCTAQAKASISTSSHLKNISIGINLDLFVAEYKSECDHYISLLEEKNND